MQRDEIDLTAPTVSRPTAGQKVDTLRRMINRQRFHLDRMSQGSRDFMTTRQDLENLEAMLLDYQPENRRRPVVTG